MALSCKGTLSGWLPALDDPDTLWLKGTTVTLNFEWDEDKASENYRKHKVSFVEGTTVFADPVLHYD